MAQTNLNIRIDNDLKYDFNALCESIGMSMTTAFCIFARKAVAEQRIPFELTTNDPFYSESNIRYLEGIKHDIETGKAHFAEHELIEVEDE